MVDGQDQDPALDLCTKGNQWKSPQGVQGLRAALSQMQGKGMWGREDIGNAAK